jgi:carbon monoxide dehydrogenase subunit G
MTGASRAGEHIMLRFEDDRDLVQPLAEVSSKLSDARFLVTCIPDVGSVTTAEADHAVCILRPGFSFVRGTLELTLRLTEVKLPTIRVLLSSKGIGTTSDVEATLTLQESGTGTRIHWVAEVKNLGGLLKAVPQGLIRGAAEKVIKDAWEGVARRLGEAK